MIYCDDCGYPEDEDGSCMCASVCPCGCGNDPRIECTYDTPEQRQRKQQQRADRLRITSLFLKQGTSFRNYYNSPKGRLVPYRELIVYRGNHVRTVNLSEGGFKRVLKIIRKIARRKAWAYKCNSFTKWSAENGYVDHYQILVERQDAL